QSTPSNVSLLQVSLNEAILSWNPPITTEEEISGYEVLYTFGQNPIKRKLGNVTQTNIPFANKATAIEASVAATSKNNIESQLWHYSEKVHIELSTTDKAIATLDEPVKINGLVIALIVFLVILILAVIIAAIFFLCFGEKGLYKLSEARK
ncbi:hypothetical protein ACTXT7_012630, partial [Hymenolepis weldensis]